ncbi:MAG: D-aminoacylase [Bacillota bacterium]|nr:D-aminoacylase [Bacillota bacterium]
MFDLVIRNGTVIDGSGGPRFRGDVGIKGQRIAAVARWPQELSPDDGPAAARRVLDVAARVVAPGFFDIHSHADRGILTNPRAENCLSQGITSVIGGNCGGSAAPLNDRMVDRLVAAGREAGREVERADIDWRTMAEFLAKVETAGPGVNFGLFAGQGTVRNFVMGTDARAPSTGELALMQDEVELAMRGGALGLSTGRSYLPGRHAGEDEIVELCAPVAAAGGLYCTHLPSEGAELFEALEEAFSIGWRTGLPIQIVHLKVYGKPNFGKAPRALRMIEAAREEGVDVLFDVYPYHFSQIGTLRRVFGAGLPAGMGPAQAAAELRRPETVGEIVAREVPAVLADRFRLTALPVTGILLCGKTPEHPGRCLAEVAAALGHISAPALVVPDGEIARAEYIGGLIRAAAELYALNDGAVKVSGQMDEGEVRLILRHPLGMFGTDAGVIDGQRDPQGTVHPRAYGTYPRILGRYVRETGTLGLEEAIRKATSLPAARVGAAERGLLKAGKYADITVFDPSTVIDTATPDQPLTYSRGIEWVLVNGAVAWDCGVCTGARSGKVLRF